MALQMWKVLPFLLASLCGAAITKQQQHASVGSLGFESFFESAGDAFDDFVVAAEAPPESSMQLVAEKDFSTSYNGNGPTTLCEYCAGQSGGDNVNIHHIGENIMADWEEYGPYYPGKISKTYSDGTFRVDYDDGFVENHVKASQIRAMTDDERSQYAKKVKTDPACKFQNVVKKLKPEVEALKEKMAMWCTNQRAQVSAIKGQAPSRALTAKNYDLDLAGAGGAAGSGGGGTGNAGASGGSGNAGAGGSGKAGKTAAAIKASDGENQVTDDGQVVGDLPSGQNGGAGTGTGSGASGNGGGGNAGATGSGNSGKQAAAIKASDGDNRITNYDGQIVGDFGAPAPALPGGINPGAGGVSPAPAEQPKMTENEAQELEVLRVQIQDNDAYLDELKQREDENAMRLQKLAEEHGVPTVQPGIKTVDDLLKEYRDRIAAQEDEIARRLKRIKEQEYELARLGASDIPLSVIDADARSIEDQVQDAWEEMKKMDAEGELDPDLKHILNGIMKPLKSIRRRINHLMNLEDVTEHEVQQVKDEEKNAAEAARKKALAMGLSAKVAAEQADEAARRVAQAHAKRLTASRMEMLGEAQIVQYDFKKSAAEAVELDIGLHPHGGKWWRFRFEHAYIEAWLMVWISLLMLSWRRIVQEVKKILQVWAAPHDEHVHRGDLILILGESAGRDDGSLYLVWLECLSEMMLTCILVFITVWVICKTTLVDLVPLLVSAREFHVPNSGDQYRRLLIDCATLYFFAILMYFILVFPVARHAKSLTHKLAKGFAVTPRSPASGQAFGHLRSEAATSLVKKEFQDKQLVANALRDEVGSYDMPEATMLNDKVDWNNFPLSEYMIMSVHVNTQSMFEFAWYLWLPVVICFLCFSGFHRFWHMGYVRIMMFFSVFAFVLILVIAWYATKVGGSMAKMDVLTGSAGSIHTKMNTEHIVIKALQFAMFFQLYGVARMIGHGWMWTLHFWPVLWLTIFALAWAILFILIITPIIPSFCAVMALPPYVNKDNIRLMLFTVQVEERKKEKESREKLVTIKE